MKRALSTHGTFTEHSVSVHSLARRPACPRSMEHGAWSEGTREQGSLEQGNNPPGLPATDRARGTTA